MYCHETTVLADELYDCLFLKKIDCTYDQVYKIVKAWKELQDTTAQHKEMIDLYIFYRTYPFSKLSSVLFRQQENKRLQVMSMIQGLLKT